MQRILSLRTARPGRGEGHHRRLGPPPPAAQVGRVPDRPGRRRAGPGRGHRPGRAGRGRGLTEESVVEVTGERRGQPGRPGRRRAGRARGTVLVGGASRRRSTCTGPTLTASLPTLLDHAGRRRCATRCGRRRSGSRPRRCAASGPHWTRPASSRCTRRRSSRRRPSPARTCSRIDYFGRPAYLAQSPQFYKQTLVGVFERVYEVGPVFRAEPHDTVRHLAQYTSLDVELGFIADHRDVMAVLRDTRGRHDGRGGRAGRRPRGVRRDGAGGAGVDPGRPLRRRGGDGGRGDRRGPVGRARPGPGARAVAGRVGAARARLGLPLRRPATRWSKRPFYTHPDPAAAGLLQRVRPAVPRPRAGHRRAAAAPLRGLPGGAGRPGRAGRSRTSPIWTCSGAGCRRTAGSRSGWSGS